MRVQIMGRTELGVPDRWAVLDDQDRLVPAISGYLAYLENIERSPNTLRATAYDLRAYFQFLLERNLTLDQVSNPVLGQFARWFRSPADNVLFIRQGEASRTKSTTNRALTTIASFYRHRGALGKDAIGAKGLATLVDSATSYRRPRSSVIDNTFTADQYRDRDVLGPRLRSDPQVLPRVLTVQEVHTLLESCRDRRDRLLVLMAFSTGMRIGQMLGLQHQDIDTRTRSLHIVGRTNNPNGARSKNGKKASIPISAQLNTLYVDYLHEEYGYVDSPYVFLNFETLEPFNYSTAYAVVQRLRRRSGIRHWSLHTLRHTFVTLARRAGLPIDVISSLVTHAHIQTTIDIYSHLDVEDLRALLVEHGVWDGAA